MVALDLFYRSLKEEANPSINDFFSMLSALRLERLEPEFITELRSGLINYKILKSTALDESNLIIEVEHSEEKASKGKGKYVGIGWYHLIKERHGWKILNGLDDKKRNKIIERNRDFKERFNAFKQEFFIFENLYDKCNDEIYLRKYEKNTLYQVTNLRYTQKLDYFWIDCEKIVFKKDGEMASLVSLSTGNKLAFTTFPRLLSPDHKKILIQDERDLYLVDIKTRQFFCITHYNGLPNILYNVSFSPDSKNLFFEGIINVSRDNGGLGLIIADINGSINSALGESQYNPLSWSPSGLKLAYVNEKNEVIILKYDGRDKNIIFSDRDSKGIQELVWSRNGDFLAFTVFKWHADYGHQSDIYVYDVKKSVAYNLTKTTMLSEKNPFFLDNRTIMYSGEIGENKFDIFAISIDGTGKRNITSTNDTNECNPQLSPDGQFISFEKEGNLYIKRIK